MQLVVNITEELYNLLPRIKNDGGLLNSIILRAVKNGTPLPKGHGRLIDANYKVSSDGRTIDTVCGYMAPTIIGADKERK